MLYRQYRPASWDEVIGQEHVVRTLQGALRNERVGHAYLFAGPRGTGKTTLARILAKAVNCTDKKKHPCNACASCTAIAQGASMDVMEIDAASNRGIDDVRDLKETAGTAPASSRKKVFVVDEVHMLSKDAFNALLKLLEEPPEHAMFILATTEPHKVLPTVLSRVQRFDFRKPTQKEIIQKLTAVSTAEKLQVQPEALTAIATAADGAFRDAEVMLTKLAAHAGGSAGKGITEDVIRQVLGLVPIGWHAQLAGLIASGDRTNALQFVQEAIRGGADVDHFTKDFLVCLRQVMMLKIDPTILAEDGLSDTYQAHLQQLAETMDGRLLIRMIQSFTDARAQLKSAPIASLPLELAIIGLTEVSQ